MNDRVTRSSVRTRTKTSTPSSSVSSGQQRSGPNASKGNNSAKPNANRPKPNDQRSSANNSRLTRSNAKNSDTKRLRDDEGPRRIRVINVGDKFQTKVPPLKDAERSDSPERETCVWAMDETQNEKDIEDFCIKVHEKLNLNSERALYHLYNNNFDYKKAMETASASADLVDEWSDNDKYCFHGLFSTYGRDFKKINQIMAHKSMRSIIEHYYRVKLQNNYSRATETDAIGYDLSNYRKNSSDDKEPDVMKPMTCQNCGVRALLYQVNNLMQCLSCRKHFEEFNFNRTLNYNEKPLNFKFADEVMSMVNDFKPMCEEQETGKTKCEEIKQNAIHTCRLLRNEALRKEVNAGKIAQKVVNEVNLDDYKKMLTLGNASSSRLRVTNVWTNNEKNVAIQALIRYGGNRDAAASILGTKTADMINEFSSKYENVLNEAIKTKHDTTTKRRQKADEQYTKMLNELKTNVEVVDID